MTGSVNCLILKVPVNLHSLSAGVIGKDPSQWYKTLVIDKGVSEGITKGFRC